MYQDSNLSIFLPTLVLLCHCSFNLTSFCIHLGILISSAVIVEVPLFKYVFYSHILACVIVLKKWFIFLSFSKDGQLVFIFIFVCLMICCCLYWTFFLQNSFRNKKCKLHKISATLKSFQFTSRLSLIIKWLHKDVLKNSIFSLYENLDSALILSGNQEYWTISVINSVSMYWKNGAKEYSIQGGQIGNEKSYLLMHKIQMFPRSRMVWWVNFKNTSLRQNGDAQQSFLRWIWKNE